MSADSRKGPSKWRRTIDRSISIYSEAADDRRRARQGGDWNAVPVSGAKPPVLVPANDRIGGENDVKTQRQKKQRGKEHRR